MSRTRAVGIDLGTTYSAVAWLPDSGRSAMIPNVDGDILTPSAVLFEDEEIVVGKEARKAGVLRINRYAECVKRDMGSPVYSRPICGEFMPPEVIQAWILKRLKADAIRGVGPDMQVVITVPAFFDEPRRKATADAGMMAGLPVLDVVNEPTAAALAFGEELGYLTPSGESREAMKVLVYDLGGGTFDVTLLDMRPGNLRTIATDGDVRLGGRDWDMRLVDFAAEAFIREHREDPRQNPAGLQRLLVEVEEAKRTLSARNNATIRVDHAGSSTVVKVTRDQFEQVTADLLERTSYTTRQLLTAAGLTWKDVNRVLLVGGSTRMPMVARMLQELSGITPDQKVHPDEAVARGAAVYCGYLLATRPDAAKPAMFHVTNVNSHSLGIEGIDPKTARKRNVIVIPRNTSLPTKVKERFVTKEENQRSIVVQVLEGESAIPGECTSIGRTALRDLPPGLPASWPVEIVYEYGINGRLKVTAQVPGTNRQVNLELEREGALSQERISRWKQVVSSDGGIDEFHALIASELKAERAGGTTYTPSPDVVHVTGGSGFRIQESGFREERRDSPAAPKSRILNPESFPAQPVPVRSGPAGSGAHPAVGSTAAAPVLVSPAGAPEANVAAPAPTLVSVPSPVPSAAPAPVPIAPRPLLAPGPARPLLVPGPGSPSTSAPVPLPQPLRRKSSKSVAVNAVGLVLSSLAGLAIGYYVLCYISPASNFLNLPASWFPWSIESGVQGTGFRVQEEPRDEMPKPGPGRAQGSRSASRRNAEP